MFNYFLEVKTKTKSYLLTPIRGVHSLNNLENTIQIALDDSNDIYRVEYVLNPFSSEKKRGEIVLKPGGKETLNWLYQWKDDPPEECVAILRLIPLKKGKSRYIRKLKRATDRRSMAELEHFYAELEEHEEEQEKLKAKLMYGPTAGTPNSGMDPDLLAEYAKGNDKE